MNTYVEPPPFWIDEKANVLIYVNLIAPKELEGAQTRACYTIVPITLYNLQVLAHHKVPVVPPMRGYNWPIVPDRTPTRAQMIMANYLVLHPRAFNLSDMGTMKTLATLWAADFLMHLHREPCRALIVAPLSTLRDVWVDEIWQNFLGNRSVRVLTGDSSRRLKHLSEPADFYIINHDGLKIGAKPGNRGIQYTGLAAAIMERTDIKLGIIDEISAYRESTSLRSRATRELLHRKDYVWGLTGTPTPNGPEDAHGLAKLITGTVESKKSWQSKVMTQISMWKWVPKRNSEAEVAKLLQPAVRFSIDDCWDLPPNIVERRTAELTQEQQRYIGLMKRDLHIKTDKGQVIDAANEAVLRTKLIQIACGCVYDADHKAIRLDNHHRLKVLREAIEHVDGKILLMSPLTAVIHMLRDELSGDYSCAIINGSVKDKDRALVLSKFKNEAHPRILIADPATMAHGLTLTIASTIIWYAPTDRTELYLQANRRISRPGQVKTTLVLQLSSTSTEKEIYRRNEANESMQGVILKLLEE